MTPEAEARETWNECPHGSSKKIADPCPSCGAHSLFIGMGGHLTCSVIGCKEPGVTVALRKYQSRIEELEALRASLQRAFNFRTDEVATLESTNSKLREEIEYWKSRSNHFAYTVRRIAFSVEGHAGAPESTGEYLTRKKMKEMCGKALASKDEKDCGCAPGEFVRIHFEGCKNPKGEKA